ncbi:MAG: hypothetical protein J6K53_09980 [Roseburia sp.]|nr:hypothetical protein [Roseburia sp.]
MDTGIHLSKDADLVDFLRRIKECASPVYFETADGDSLALHSALCQYIFCSLAAQPDILYNGRLRFGNPAEEELLSAFLDIQT